MKHKAIKIIIGLILIAFIWKVGIKHLAHWYQEKEYTFNSEIEFVSIYTHNDLKLNYYEINSFKSLFKKSMQAVDSLLDTDKTNIRVFISTGSGAAKTDTEFNNITLFNSDYCYSSFTHEYLHIKLGMYKELWFTEGIATYLAQYIRKNNQKLKKYCEHDDTFLIDDRSLLKGKLKATHHLDGKYDNNSIRKLVFDTRYFLELSDDNVLDYYFLSASFCQYLFDEVGFDTMLDLAKVIKDTHNSIEKEFEIREIDLTQLTDNWLSDF